MDLNRFILEKNRDDFIKDLEEHIEISKRNIERLKKCSNDKEVMETMCSLETINLGKRK